MSQLLFEKRSQNLGEHVPPPNASFDVSAWIPKEMIREESLDLPELSELDVVRHFTQLAKRISVWTQIFIH